MLELSELRDTVAPMTLAEEAPMEPHDENPDTLAGELVEPDHDLDIDSFTEDDEDSEVDR